MNCEADAEFPVRIFVTSIYGRNAHHRIEPSKYRCAELAADLADAFAPIQLEVAGSTSLVLGGMRSFLTWISGEANATELMLGDVTADHLAGWERFLSARQQVMRTHAAYNLFVNFRALLLRIANDGKIQLQPTLVDMLANATVTTMPEMRPLEGLPPFTAQEQRQILKAAYRDVGLALQRAHCGDTVEVRRAYPNFIVALHILLLAGSGEPPEVLRRIKLTDVRAKLPDQMARPSSTRYVSLIDAISLRPPGYELDLTKTRSHQRYSAEVRRSGRHSCFAVEASIILTKQFRVEERSDALWIDEFGRHQVFIGPRSLRSWLINHEIAVEGPAAFGRFRKQVVGAEAMADPAAYLALAKRHRPTTFFASYTNNPILRAHSGRILVESIEEAFRHAVTPTVVTPETETVLRSGGTSMSVNLTRKETSALLAGELDGPHAACRNPTNSPFEQIGHPCGASATGLCFICPNAVVTEAHLPVLLYFEDRFAPSRSADYEQWSRTQEPIWRSITDQILPRFSDASKDKARLHVAETYVDIRLRQETGT